MTQHELRALFERWTGLPAGALHDSWELVPYVRRDEVAAMASIDGASIHFAVAPGWRGRLLTRARIREFLRPLLGRHGFLTTSAVAGTCDDFIRRLGFAPTWHSNGINHYMLTELPFGSAEN